LQHTLKAYLKGQQPYELPENIINNFIKKHNYQRIDFLGNEPGLWSLHPPYKTPYFFSKIEEILRRISENDFPESQIGNYDIVDDFHDWSDAREKLRQNKWYRKLLRF